MIGIGDMYRCAHRINSYGIEGYQVEPKYEATSRIRTKIRRRRSARPASEGITSRIMPKFMGKYQGLEYMTMRATLG